MIQEYRKKPVVIKAVQWNGENIGEIIEFCGENACISELVYFFIGLMISCIGLNIFTIYNSMQASNNSGIIWGIFSMVLCIFALYGNIKVIKLHKNASNENEWLELE